MHPYYQMRSLYSLAIFGILRICSSSMFNSPNGSSHLKMSTSVLIDPKIKLFSRGERKNQGHEIDDVDSVTQIQGNRDVSN